MIFFVLFWLLINKIIEVKRVYFFTSTECDPFKYHRWIWKPISALLKVFSAKEDNSMLKTELFVVTAVHPKLISTSHSFKYPTWPYWRDQEGEHVMFYHNSIERWLGKIQIKSVFCKPWETFTPFKLWAQYFYVNKHWALIMCSPPGVS